MTKWMVTKENTKHLISMSYGFVCAFLCVDQIYRAFLTYGKENKQRERNSMEDIEGEERGKEK